MVPEFLLETTPASELEILEVQKNMSVYNRERGTGRPTKKNAAISTTSSMCNFLTSC